MKAQVRGRGDTVPQAPSGVGWTAVSRAATLLVCAAFCHEPCRNIDPDDFLGVHWSARTQVTQTVASAAQPHQQHRSSEGRILAASRPAKTSRTSSAYAPRRISFGRIDEQLEVPNLLALQTESFDWLVGNEAWQTRSTDDPHAHSGLA